MIQSGPTMGDMSCTPGRNSEWMECQGLATQGRENNIGAMGERRRALESNEFSRGGQGSLERYGGLPRVVILTPEGGQLINMGIGRGYVFTVISQEAAARYAMHRSKLPEPLMITGPAGLQVRASGRCEIAFPQEKGVGGKMVIFAFEVDKLEELYETPYGGLERWHMQLGEEDEGYLRWLRVAQMGVLRADPRTGDARSGEGEPVHVEVPCVQGATDDGDGVAYGRACMEHACVTPVGRRRDPAGTHGAA
jgi:hypothetical protein